MDALPARRCVPIVHFAGKASIRRRPVKFALDIRMRAVIIGNSGSGKTWLAARLAEKWASRVVHLDEVFWLPGGFNAKRPSTDVYELVEKFKRWDAWVVEGVFGELASQFFAQADELLWLDLPWAECRRRLDSRGSESKAHMNREQSEQGLKELVHWAEGYYLRQDSRSFAGHGSLFERFPKAKHRLCSEGEVVEYVNGA
ncbi:MAG: AAA family ATPase [Gemmataceae bacterium]